MDGPPQRRADAVRLSGGDSGAMDELRSTFLFRTTRGSRFHGL